METAEAKLTQFLSPLGSIANSQVQSKLFAVSLAFLLDAVNFDYQGHLTEIAQTSGLNPAQFKAVAQGILILFSEALSHGVDVEYLKRRCQALSVTEASIALIAEAWQSQNSKLASHLLSKIVTQNKLVDLDWSFGVTAASDDCDHVGKTFLQLKLTVEQEQGGRRVIFLELSLDQFYQFLASLEKCKTYLDFVSPR